MRQFFLAFTLVAALTGIHSSAQQSPSIETIDIGALEPGDQTFAEAINNRGVVAGFADNGLGADEPRLRAFTWTRAGGFRVIAHNADAKDINDHGVVIGSIREPGSAWAYA